MANVPVITRRAALVGAIASSAALAVPAVAAINPTETEISKLFAEWLIAANGPQDDAFDDKWEESPYARLQARIVAAEPMTARDLAMQFYCDSDQFDSEYTNRFRELVQQLVGAI